LAGGQTAEGGIASARQATRGVRRRHELRTDLGDFWIGAAATAAAPRCNGRLALGLNFAA
jgi:hypothetical protein